MGDGESAEGSVWEAASFAGYYKLDNLVGIIDVNRYVHMYVLGGVISDLYMVQTGIMHALL